MKNPILGTVLIILISLSASTCKKDKLPAAVLPQVTQEGKNTIGFTIDGQVWVPYAQCGFSQSACAEYRAAYSSPAAAPNGIAFTFSRKTKEKGSNLTISSAGVGTITSTGNKIDSILVVFASENANGLDGRYAYPAAGSKFIITKLDTENHIISGEFEFILQEQNNSGNTITIREGRFDFAFNACHCSQ